MNSHTLKSSSATAHTKFATPTAMQATSQKLQAHSKAQVFVTALALLCSAPSPEKEEEGEAEEEESR